MEWTGDGYILAAKPHGETSCIVNVFTKDKGRHAGIVRGGRSRRMRPILQAGNKVRVRWNARLSEHLGIFSIEPMESRAAALMLDKMSLAGLNAVVAISMQGLPEREPFAKLYDIFTLIIEQLEDAAVWPALYVRYELALLQALGYGLDMSQCTVTGESATATTLTHISPRTGRAVCFEAAQPYMDKLLKLPPFLISQAEVHGDDILDGLNLTGFFLKKWVFENTNRDLPEARLRMVNAIKAHQV